MTTRLSLMAAILFLAQLSFSQNQISGKVTNQTGEGVFFATTALYALADSTVAQAESTDDDGRFNLKNIPDGEYFLVVTMLGYLDEQVSNISFPKDNRKNFDLTISEDAETLSTVEVTAKAPLLEQRPDRLIVNVENNITSMNSSLLDVMKKVPGMLVIGDKLSMAGQRNITILINGKTTKYMDVQSLLKDLPGDNIKKVEVIHQPGAEFEAEGTGPIINIILKKNSLFGTNGSLSAGVAKGENWRNRTTLNLSHYQGKLNINGGIGFRRNAWYERLDIVRFVGDDKYTQSSEDPDFSNVWRGNLSVDYDITERHRIGAASRYVQSKRDYTITNTTDIDFASDELDDLRLLTNNFDEGTWQLFTLNPYYIFEIDTSGQKLNVDFNYVEIENNGMTTLQPDEVLIGEFFPGQLYDRIGDTKIYTASVDYKYPFSKNIDMQIGGRYNKADLDNNLMSFDENISGEWVENLRQSNHFLFDETIWAGYGKMNWLYGKWSGTAGLRYEDSESIGYSITLDSTQKRDIKKLFPSGSLSREITKQLGATFSYSYRIDRPRYSNLNPFVYYLDPFTYELGNPILAPALTHSTKFSLTYDKQPFFNVEYKVTDDIMVEVTNQDDETGETYLTTENFDKFYNFNVSLFFPLDFIPKVTGYGGFIANRGKYESDYLDQQFVSTVWDYTAFIQSEFKLPLEINAELGGWWNSGGQDGIIRGEWLYGVSTGISREFLDDKLRLSFGVENFLNRFFHGKIEYANMNLDIVSSWDAPVYNFQATYKFGNQHMKSKDKHKSSASDMLRRAQD